MELVFAYIDPGAGSLIIQAAIAGLVAIPIFFRTQIRRAISAIRRPNAQPPGPVTGSANGGDDKPGA